MKNEPFEHKITAMGRTFAEGVRCPAVPFFESAQPAVRPRPKLRWVLIAAACVVLLSGLTAAASLGAWYTGDPTGGLRMRLASAEGLTDQPMAQASDQGITIRVVEAAAGQDRILLRVQFNGEVEAIDGSLVAEGDMTVTDEAGSAYPMTHDNRMAWKRKGEGSLLQADKRGNYEETFELVGQPPASGTVTLCITAIGGRAGRWEVSFPLTCHPAAVYAIDQTFPCGAGTLYVDKAVTDALGTAVYYRLDGVEGYRLEEGEDRYDLVTFDVWGADNYPYRLLADEGDAVGFAYNQGDDEPTDDGLVRRSIMRLPEEATLAIRFNTRPVCEIRLEEYV